MQHYHGTMVFVLLLASFIFNGAHSAKSDRESQAAHATKLTRPARRGRHQCPTPPTDEQALRDIPQCNRPSPSRGPARKTAGGRSPTR
eukprot:985086-Prymnesium_polylepis.1